MAVGTGAMIALTAAQGISKFVGQRKQAKAVERAGAGERDLFNLNAAAAEHQADDALARGREQESLARTQTRQTIGSQRAAMAGNGIALGDGSAADVQADTAALGELDALTIKNNATREAWGYKVERANYRAQGELAYAGARNQAGALRDESFSTLLTTGAQIGSIYSTRPQSTVPKLSTKQIKAGALTVRQTTGQFRK